MRWLYPTLAALSLATPALAQQGTCNTMELQFEGTEDKNWLASNQQKVFTFDQQDDRLALDYTAPGMESARTDMVVIGDGPLTNIAAMTTIVGLEVFAWQATAGPGEPFEATYSVISSGFVNTWVLTCRP